MDFSSLILTEPSQAVAEQKIEDVIQIQGRDRYITEAVHVTGFEMVKYSTFDSLTFLVAATQISDVIAEEEQKLEDEIEHIMTDK